MTTLKRGALRLLALFAISAALNFHVQAQQFNVGFGVSALGAPTSNLESGKQSMAGGAYPSFSGDFLFWRRVGIQGEVAWRASENRYQGFQPYRTILYDFNGIYAPDLGQHAAIEIMGGIGGVSNRFYTNYYNCTFTGCTNYVSSSHFMGHVGAGIKLYVTEKFFIRPEAHGYFIHNNEEFADNVAYRVGASIGYTFGERGKPYERRHF